jgi:glycosyltransferase involved in cell wall biosynthesis
MKQPVAVIAFETPHAPGGGIAAVLGQQPGVLGTVLGTRIPIVTPRHRRIKKMNALPEGEIQTIGTVTIPSPIGEVRVAVQFYEKTNTYFLDLVDPRLDPPAFSGFPTPYRIQAGPLGDGNASAVLLRDALLFGTAVPHALKIIEPAAGSWTLLLQDWEAATVALTSAKHALLLTLHNSYDSGALSDALLLAHGLDPRMCPGPLGTNAGSVLERAIPHCRMPVLTVSEQFAADLVTDAFQTRVMADHLQKLFFARGLKGVDNGPFAAMPRDLLGVIEAGDRAGIQGWKTEQRQLAVAALREFSPTPENPVWGDRSQFDFASPVWFIMAGRDDTRQKGYDVAASAIRSYLSKGGNAQFLFYPILGDEGLAGISFLEALALEFRQRVLVFPGFFPGFEAVLRGATFGLMPSLYEPFGMANEYYLKGVPVVARATGGIIQQVVPLRACGSFSAGVQNQVARYYSHASAPSGILVREADDISSAVQDWSRINAASYLGQVGLDRLAERRDLLLFQEMAREFCLGITEAARIAMDESETYHSMIIAGAQHIRRSFSWVRNANEYARAIGSV